MRAVGRSITAAVAVSAAVAVAVIPGVSSAKTAAAKAKSHAMNINIKSTQTGTKLTGTYSGKPWGTGKISGTLVIPTATIVFHTKLGNATIQYKGTIHDGTKVSGHYKFIHGTGKLKNVTGSGEANGDLTGAFNYTGTVRY